MSLMLRKKSSEVESGFATLVPNISGLLVTSAQPLCVWFMCRGGLESLMLRKKNSEVESVRPTLVSSILGLFVTSA